MCPISNDKKTETRKKLSFLLPAILLGFATLYAQPLQKPVHFEGKTYLSGGVIDGGELSKRVFDSLVALPLVIKDSTGQSMRVSEFRFIYAERALYEDSAGHPIILADYISTTSVDGVLPANWVAAVRRKSKPGDTALFTEVITVRTDTILHDTKTTFTKPIRIIITP